MRHVRWFEGVTGNIQPIKVCRDFYMHFYYFVQIFNSILFGFIQLWTVNNPDEPKIKSAFGKINTDLVKFETGIEIQEVFVCEMFSNKNCKFYNLIE